MPAEMQTPLLAGWALSIAVLVITLIAVVFANRGRKKGDSTVSAWLVYTIGIYFTAFFMLISQELAGLAGSEGSPIIIDTVFNCFQMLSTGRDIELDVESISWMGNLLPLYMFYNASLFVAAPVGTLGTIFALANNYLGLPVVQIKARKRNLFVISDLNDRSLELGKSVIQNSSDNLVVFANVENVKAALASDARMAGARCLPQAVDYIAERIGGNAMRDRAFVFTSDDELKNLEGGLTTASRVCGWADQGNCPAQVLIFSSSTVAGPAVDAASRKYNSDKVRVRIRRIDRIRSGVEMLLDSYPLFATGIDEACMHGDYFEPKLTFDYGPSTRRILIVGKNAFAKEYLKGALWASQSAGEINTQIDITDAEIDSFKSHFMLECPEFFAPEGHPYHDHYHIRFFSADPEGIEYKELLSAESEFGDYTHVFVALDDELACAKVACRTRELLEQRRLRNGGNPTFIAVNISNAQIADMLRSMKSRKRLYAIMPIGDAGAMYSYDNIFNPTLLRQAQNVNRVYSEYMLGGKSGTEFQQGLAEADLSLANSEYNLRSSIAAALHRKYALYLFCRKANSDAGRTANWTLPLDQMDPEPLREFQERCTSSDDLNWLSRIEHDRWSAYVSAEGHEYASADDLPAIWEAEDRHNFELARMHPCLIDFDDLPQLDKAVIPVKRAALLRAGEEDKPDEKLDPKFQRIDDNVVLGIGMITASNEQEFEQEWHRFFGA